MPLEGFEERYRSGDAEVSSQPSAELAPRSARERPPPAPTRLATICGSPHGSLQSGLAAEPSCGGQLRESRSKEWGSLQIANLPHLEGSGAASSSDGGPHAAYEL